MKVTNAKIINIQVSKEFIGETSLRGEGSLKKASSISKKNSNIGSLEGYCKRDQKLFHISAGNNGVVKLLNPSAAEAHYLELALTKIITASV